MNLPSSLALPQSKLLRSPVGLLILVAAAALIGVVAFFALRAPSPVKLPTAATSPAAQVLPRTAVTGAPAGTVGTPVFYGPPAPDWVKRDLSVVPKAPAPVASSGVKTAGAPTSASTVAAQGSAATSVAGVPGAAVPAPIAGAPLSATGVKPAAGTVTGVPAVPGAAASAAASRAVPLPTTMPVAGTGAMVNETPQVLDPNTLFQREQYVYQTAGRRDPFQSLLDGRFESQTGDGALVDVGDIHLVGIMWGSSDKFALVEDSRGRGYVLRVGDPVVSGYISGISKTELQVVQNAFGDSQTVTIQLKSKEEGDPNATRTR
jgi:hypothetical protein